MIIRRGSTTSAMAPAGSVNRKIGSVVAVCSSETSNGLRSNVVISQPDAVSYIAMPISAQVLAVQTIAKAGWANAPSIGDGLDCGSWAKRKFIFNSLLAGPARLS